MSGSEYADEYRDLSELEPGPKTLRLATEYGSGFDARNLIMGLGFVINEETAGGSLVLVGTPSKLLGKDWKIYYPRKSEDPLLFTIYIDHGRGVILPLFRQIKVGQWDDKKGKFGKERYILFTL